MIKIWGLTLHLYGLFLGLGVWAMAEVGGLYLQEKDIKEESWWRVVWTTILAALIGARLYHVLSSFNYYQTHPVEILFIWQGGLGIWGAILAGGLSLIIQTKQHVWNYLGAFALGLPLAQAIGRLGNYFNKEIYGLETNLPWGIKIDNTGKTYHPLFAYEALANFILFGIIFYLSKKYRSNKINLACYLIGYGLIRISLETLRFPTDQWLIGNISMASVSGLIAIATGLVIWQKRT